MGEAARTAAAQRDAERPAGEQAHHAVEALAFADAHAVMHAGPQQLAPGERIAGAGADDDDFGLGLALEVGQLPRQR